MVLAYREQRLRRARVGKALQADAPNVSTLPERPPLIPRVRVGPGIRRALQEIEDKKQRNRK